MQKSDNKKQVKNTIVTLIIVFVFVLLIIGFKAFAENLPSMVKEVYPNNSEINWKQFIDTVGVVVSTFGFIVLIVTVILQIRALGLQREEMRKTQAVLNETATANKSLTNNNLANSLISFYEKFTGEFLIKQRSGAWNTLLNCVRSKAYCDFIIENYFASEPHRYYAPEHLIAFLKEAYSDLNYKFADDNELKKIEQSDRYAVEDVLNFFNLLSMLEAPNSFYKRCNFYYDFW